MKHSTVHLFRSGLLALLIAAFSYAARAQSVGIGTTTPDASAALEVAGTARGLLVPRLTAAQLTAVAKPATGLLVYQTDRAAGFYFNAGPPAAPAWQLLSGAADNLGNHTATTALNLAGQALTGTGANIGAAVGVGVRADGGLNLGQNTTGNNVYLGFQSGAANTMGTNNTFTGTSSGAGNTTGAFNTFTGSSSGRDNTTGFNNTFTGASSGQANTTGVNNTFIGSTSGDRNTAGNNNTCLGNASDVSSGALFNATALGSGAVVNGSNKVRLGNPAVTVVEGQVAYSFPSDARFKYDVQADVPGLAFVRRLRPVTYRFDGAKLDRFGRTGLLPPGCTPDSAAAIQTGFLAQEVEAAAHALGYRFDGVHAPAGPRDHYSLAYSQFVMPLVRAVQEQQAQIEALQARAATAEARAAQASADHAALQTLQAQVARLLGPAQPGPTWQSEAAPAPAAPAQAHR